MNDDLARQRFMVMNAVRLSGAVLAAIGLAIIAEKMDFPKEIGWFFFILGAFEVLFMPKVLASRWKSPPQ